MERLAHGIGMIDDKVLANFASFSESYMALKRSGKSINALDAAFNKHLCANGLRFADFDRGGAFDAASRSKPALGYDKPASRAAPVAPARKAPRQARDQAPE